MITATNLGDVHLLPADPLDGEAAGIMTLTPGRSRQRSQTYLYSRMPMLALVH